LTVGKGVYGFTLDQNIGEFLLFIPGVSIATSGSEPTTVALRGFPGLGRLKKRLKRWRAWAFAVAKNNCPSPMY
jgi:hypothetical protein